MSGKVIIKSLRELPPVPRTLGGMTWNPTGLWRYLAPVPRDKAAPCHTACPARNPIPQLMAAMAAGEAARAWDLVTEVNPLPGVTGRLCYHPCQRDCLRGGLDRALAIQLMERSVADLAPAGAAKAPATGQGPRVAVAGAGPAGLTCAYLLGRAGCQVRILDSEPRAGGFLIGAKGLADTVLREEVRRLVAKAGLELGLGSMGLGNMDTGGMDLVVVDTTAHPAGSEAAQAVEALADELRAAGVRVLCPDLEDGFKGFKAAQVAHAVGLGQDLAAQARALLAGGEPAAAPELEPLERGAVKLERFMAEEPPSPAPAPEGEGGLPVAAAAAEAARCLSCGTCNLCQECVLFCPDACLALDPAGQAIAVDLGHCKGCGVCAEECPRGVIAMEAE